MSTAIAALDTDLIPPHDDRIDGCESVEQFVQHGNGFVYNLLVGRLGLRPDHKVLDIGSGTGQKARPLTKVLTAGEYHGFDVMRSAVEWCADRYARFPNFHFHHADLHSDWYNAGACRSAADFRFPFEDATFDVAFMASVATHLMPVELANYLSETARVLKPGGRLLMTCFMAEGELAGHEAIQDRQFQRAGGVWVIDAANPRRGVCYEESVVREMHATAGLRVCEIAFGSWSGPEILGTLQDLITSVKRS